MRSPGCKGTPISLRSASAAPTAAPLFSRCPAPRLRLPLSPGSGDARVLGFSSSFKLSSPSA